MTTPTPAEPLSEERALALASKYSTIHPAHGFRFSRGSFLMFVADLLAEPVAEIAQPATPEPAELAAEIRG